MSFPKHLIGYGITERKKSWATNQIEKYGPELSWEMNALAGFTEIDAADAQFIYETDRMPSECPLEEILAVSAWAMITKGIWHELKNDLAPNFGKIAGHAISARLEIEGAWRFPGIMHKMEFSDFEAGFGKAARMPLGRYRLPLACLWLESALCHNGIFPFLVNKGMRDFLTETDGLFPGTVLRLLEADRGTIVKRPKRAAISASSR